LRKEAGAVEKTALQWNPQGYRRRGRPKRTWRRTIEYEIRNTGRSWNEVKGKAGDRNAWKLFMDALYCTRSLKMMMMIQLLTHSKQTSLVSGVARYFAPEASNHNVCSSGKL
jgi:hypothetical protein